MRSTQRNKPWVVLYVSNCAHKIRRFSNKKTAIAFAHKFPCDPYNGYWVDLVFKSSEVLVGRESGFYRPGMRSL